MSSVVWKQQHIQRAEAVTDALEVGLAYAARISEWIILLCILLTVSQALPGVHFPLVVSNVILWLQIITLDVAGLSLMALEKDARANGNRKAANQARAMMWSMIVVTMITLFAVNLANLVPSLAWLTDKIDFVLVFIRIGISLIFKFVIVNIRSLEVQVIPMATHDEKVRELNAEKESELATIRAQFEEEKRKEIERLNVTHESELQETINRLETRHTQYLQSLLESDVRREETLPISLHELVIFDNEMTPQSVPTQETFSYIEYAPVMQQIVTSQETEKVPEQETEPLPTVVILGNENVVSEVPSKAQKQERKKEQSSASSSNKLNQVRNILRRNPQATPTLIAERLQITTGYASRLKARIQQTA